MQKKKKFIRKEMFFIFGILLLINFISAVSLSPYSHYLLNENNGTSVGDSSGNNRNGTAISSPSWISGKLNNALQFNGINQYVNFTNISIGNFERNETHSFEFWFKTNNTGQQIFMSKMLNSGTYVGWDIWFEGTSTNRTYFDLTNTATSNMIRVYFTNSSISNNIWHNLIITYDGSSTALGVKFYFDGSLKSTMVIYDSLTSSSLTAVPFQISGRGNGATGIVGSLDELVFYNKVLNQSDVDFRYNNGTGTENMSSISCSENWNNYNTTCGNYCGSWNKFMTYYLDNNNCGTSVLLPSNNGTCYSCDYCVPNFSCSLFNATCSGSPPTDYNCIMANDTSSCCNTTELSEDCVYSGNLSDFDISTIIEDLLIDVPSYPYVDLNETYQLVLEFPTNNLSNVKIYITELDNNISIINFTNVNNQFFVNLLFTQEGDYPFVINGTNPCFTINNSVNGIFFVRKPYYITFNLYKDKSPMFFFMTNKYINDFAYITAEFTNETTFYHYNTELQRYFYPITYIPDKYKKPVFFGKYINGQATIKLYDVDTFAFRLIDGEIIFPYSYSIPNITKSYGINVYLGEFIVNGSSQNFTIYISDKELHPYKHMFNVVFVIFLVLIMLVSFSLFFIFPQYPLFPLSLGLGGTIMLLILRILLWVLLY